DEWYKFRAHPAADVRILEAWEEGDATGAHPAVWCHEFDGGRAWYTAMGHTQASYQEQPFLESLYQGLMWAANGRPLDGAKPAVWLLSGGRSWQKDKDEFHNGGKGVDLKTAESYGDLWVHTEFKIPPGGNSGVYLQGRYEVQIFDSYGTAKDK